MSYDLFDSTLIKKISSRFLSLDATKLFTQHVESFLFKLSSLLCILANCRNQPVTILEEEKKSDDEDDVPAWKKPKL